MEDKEDSAGTLTLDTPSGASTGDFVWALCKAQQWWPGRIRAAGDVPAKSARERPADGHSVFVTFFGNGGAAWCEAEKVRDFAGGFSELVDYPNAPNGLGRAVGFAVDSYRRCLEAELTCVCVPVEALGKSRGQKGVGGVAASVANAVPSELLRRFSGFACDVSAGNTLDAAVLRSWIMGFLRSKGRYAPFPEFSVCKGLQTYREKVDGNVDGELQNDADEACEDDDGKKKQRSMADLIAGFDVGAVGEEDDMKGVGSMPRRRLKEQDPVVKDLNVDFVDDVREGVGSGRRERKKSKYLCYPYTLVDMRERRVAGEKSSEKKMGGQDVNGTAGTDADEGKPEKSSRSRFGVGVYQDEEDFVLSGGIAPSSELLMELHLAALDAMYLVGNEFDHIVRGFFGKFRCFVYAGVDGRDGKFQSSASGNSVKTVDLEKSSETETPVQEVNGCSLEGKFDKVNKCESISMAKGLGGTKQRSNTYKKKKSIGGIMNNSIQETQSSGHEGAAPVIQEANCSNGVKLIQTRKRKEKDRVSDGMEAFQKAAAVHELNGFAGIKSAKKLARMKNEQVGANAGALLIGNVGQVSDTNGFEEGSLVKKKTELAITDNHGQEADGTGEVKPAKKGRKRKEQVDGKVNGSQEIKSAKKGGKKKEQANMEAGGTPVMLAGQGTLCSEDGKSMNVNNSMMKSSLSVDVHSGAVLAMPIQSMPGVIANIEGKPRQKRQWKKKDGKIAGEGVVQAANDEGKPKKKVNTTNKGTSVNKRAAFVLSFSVGVEVPSKEELLPTHSKFSTLSESETTLNNPGSASIVFANNSDAEKAYNCSDKDIALGNSLDASHLQYLHRSSNNLAPSTLAQKPPLEFVKKSLECMITTLAASGMPMKDAMGADVGMKVDSKANLVDEMSGLLKKVNNMLGSSSTAGGDPPAREAT